MYKIVLAVMLYSLPLNAALIPKVSLLCNPVLRTLQVAHSIVEQKRTLTQDEASAQDGVLLAGFKSLLKQDGYCASGVLDFAVDKKNHALVEGLLLAGVKPHSSHITKAALLDDHTLVSLLSKNTIPVFTHEAYQFTFEMMKSFLENGACFTGSAVGNLFKCHLECRIRDKRWRGEYRSLSDVERADLLKKVTLLERAGDSLDFWVTNPLSCEESVQKYRSWSCQINCRFAERDWTFGVFPELAAYIQAALVCRGKDATPAENEEAKNTIAAIMEQYAIDKNEVTVGTYGLSNSSRIVEE